MTAARRVIGSGAMRQRGNDEKDLQAMLRDAGKIPMSDIRDHYDLLSREPSRVVEIAEARIARLMGADDSLKHRLCATSAVYSVLAEGLAHEAHKWRKLAECRDLNAESDPLYFPTQYPREEES